VSLKKQFNLVDRSAEPVLNYRTEHDIGFIPYRPLATGSLAAEGSPFGRAGERSRLDAGPISGPRAASRVDNADNAETCSPHVSGIGRELVAALVCARIAGLIPIETGDGTGKSRGLARAPIAGPRDD
jgi:hypothetical protein